MSDSNYQGPVPNPNGDCVSDSPNTVIFYDDGEGDTTVRPIPPELLPQAIAEREKIQAWLAARKLQQKAPDGQ
jgi:hypothetical protein